MGRSTSTSGRTEFRLRNQAEGNSRTAENLQDTLVGAHFTVAARAAADGQQPRNDQVQLLRPLDNSSSPAGWRRDTARADRPIDLPANPSIVFLG
jgi:hypothetical protein